MEMGSCDEICGGVVIFNDICGGGVIFDNICGGVVIFYEFE